MSVDCAANLLAPMLLPRKHKNILALSPASAIVTRRSAIRLLSGAYYAISFGSEMILYSFLLVEERIIKSNRGLQQANVRFCGESIWFINLQEWVQYFEVNLLYWSYIQSKTFASNLNAVLLELHVPMSGRAAKLILPLLGFEIPSVAATE